MAQTQATHCSFTETGRGSRGWSTMTGGGGVPSRAGILSLGSAPQLCPRRSARNKFLHRREHFLPPLCPFRVDGLSWEPQKAASYVPLANPDFMLPNQSSRVMDSEVATMALKPSGLGPWPGHTGTQMAAGFLCQGKGKETLQCLPRNVC